eukprot:CAMPEP_0180135822 /NCGR_PEP_ID=MMETSP0986-20121125/11081_1 /TAXON_ID=697907 /ORGANISM="non described non described, Strain CCMP2293" /LENGTH=89 /DNA_ID=CAMNT_0022076637 /DNA_START=225 /DNA_END=491 /DNA_ORIENTATION=-
MAPTAPYATQACVAQVLPKRERGPRLTTLSLKTAPMTALGPASGRAREASAAARNLSQVARLQRLLYLKWPGSQIRPPRGPRQVLGPYG